MALFHVLTLTTGRPPANASVVAILSVRAPPWPDWSAKRIVTGPMSWKMAMGKNPIACWPTVNVTGPQMCMRESLGL
jgi:hypothetical protein